MRSQEGEEKRMQFRGVLNLIVVSGLLAFQQYKINYIEQEMSTPQSSETKTNKYKSSPYQALFKQPLPSPKKAQLNQVYQLIQKDTLQATKKCFSRNQEPLNTLSTDYLRNRLLQKHNPQIQRPTPIKMVTGKIQTDNEEEMEKKKLRTLSSKKFDCVNKKKNSKRVKKFAFNLLEYVKLNEGGSSNSKKSTDNSNSEEIEKIKNENELISESIKAEVRRIKQIQKQINEQQKKHQSEKQLYKLNILKLKKKVCGDQEPSLREIDEIRESFLSENQDHEEYDTLSIDSH